MNGLIFSGENVRAILEGRKTQTRRVVKKILHRNCSTITEFGVSSTDGYDSHFRDKRLLWHDVRLPWLLEHCPYGKPGDRLWVKERWRIDSWDVSGQEFSFQYEDKQTSPVKDLCYEMEEDVLERWRHQCDEDCKKAGRVPDADGVYWLGRYVPTRWRNPIFMPRVASRLTLGIVDIRVERLQDISEADAIAEGCHWSNGDPQGECGPTTLCVEAKDEYRHAWNKLNDKRGFPWESNPWVWVIEFRKGEL